MNVESTPLNGLLLVHPRVHSDARGFFFESYHEARYQAAGIDARFVQDNHSASSLGTLRGLHAQQRQPQAKLVRCLFGSIFDVAVDVREGSATFGQWHGVELSAQNHRQLYVPMGFLHGFCVTSETAQVEYKCSDVYAPDDQVTVRWDDPDLGIAWPNREPLLSDKDKVAPFLRDLTQVFPVSFNDQDRAQLAERGISEAEAERQGALFAHPPKALALTRPATVGDGIQRLDAAAQADAEAKGTALLSKGRVTKFVPASGAATRMFKDLLAALEKPDGLPTGDCAKTLEQGARFAFFNEWCQLLGVKGEKAFDMLMAKGQWRDVLKALLFEPGLGYAQAPKAFLGFHDVDGRAHTALEDHWREAAALGLKRLHFTVSREHESGLHALVGWLRPMLRLEKMPAVEPGYSFQDPATDTLAGDGQGGFFRDAEGRLVLRPGGHGALITNLQAIAAEADVAVLKNIDNIAHPRLWDEQLRWKRILAGVLAAELEKGWDRPVRVVGVVPNTGEPGGGPFWVGDSLQVVESAQVDLADPAQKAVFQAATHFNPVDIVCRLTDSAGKAFDLEAYLDPQAVFLSHKSHLGRPLVALERPGLWNGAMAHWRTIFVEVPLETFNPVKVITDLLKPAHQP